MATSDWIGLGVWPFITSRCVSCKQRCCPQISGTRLGSRGSMSDASSLAGKNGYETLKLLLAFWNSHLSKRDKLNGPSRRQTRSPGRTRGRGETTARKYRYETEPETNAFAGSLSMHPRDARRRQLGNKCNAGTPCEQTRVVGREIPKAGSKRNAGRLVCSPGCGERDPGSCEETVDGREKTTNAW